MRPQDIQIGDWCHLHYVNRFDGEVSFNFKVTQLRIDYGNEILVWGDKTLDGKHFGNMGEVSKIEPVPITEEMLEKWGFQKNKGDQWVIEKKHPVGCCGQTCSNTNPTDYAVWVDRFGMGCVSYLEQEGNANLDGGRYVHQLQHLLRMFGIDKYIKIEL